MNKTTEDSLIILELRYESACISRDYALHKIEELKEENLMLADENKKMAEYLLYLDEGMVIELERDGFGWLF
jgi:hypothetical protein